MGTIRARSRATVEAKVSGRIVELPVGIGQEVLEGALLVRLEDSEYQARLGQAAAGRDLARRDLERHHALLRDEAVTQAEFDAVEAGFRLAEARVKEIESTLAEMRIKAPFAGVIARKWADSGDMAIPGKALLEIDLLGSPQLEAPVPESLLGGLSLGQTCMVQVAVLPGWHPGRVVEIAGAGDPQTRTVWVKFNLPSELPVRPGQFARVLVPAGAKTILEVPPAALLTRGQLEYVFVVADRTARLRLVKTGRHRAEGVELLSGLDPGEWVVVQGADSLKDGQPVRTEGTE